MGDMERRILDDCKRTGAPLPDRVKQAPTLTWGLKIYYDAFTSLVTCRNMNSVIPWDCVMEYADRNGLDEEQRASLWYHISVLDRVHREETKPAKGNKNGK